MHVNFVLNFIKICCLVSISVVIGQKWHTLREDVLPFIVLSCCLRLSTKLGEVGRVA
jgi:hypothetical protein